MIGKLTGTLAEEPAAGAGGLPGVGYEVDVPMSTFYNLPGVGEKVALLTHFVVREDAQILFGFGSGERARGIPPTHQDLRRRAAHGAGRHERHERGRHRPGRHAAGRQPAGQGARASARRPPGAPAGAQGQDRRRPGPRGRSRRPRAGDILQALVALGYSDKEAAAAVKSLPKDVSVSEGIKQALKALAREHQTDDFAPRRTSAWFPPRPHRRRKRPWSARCVPRAWPNTWARPRRASSWRSSSAPPASAARRWTTCCCSARRAWARPRCRTSSPTSWA